MEEDKNTGEQHKQVYKANKKAETIKLFALDCYRVIVDEDVNYPTMEIESE